MAYKRRYNCQNSRLLYRLRCSSVSEHVIRRTGRKFAMAGHQHLKIFAKCCQMSCCPADQYLAAVCRRKISVLFIAHCLMKLLPSMLLICENTKISNCFTLRSKNLGCQAWKPGGCGHRFQQSLPKLNQGEVWGLKVLPYTDSWGPVWQHLL